MSISTEFGLAGLVVCLLMCIVLGIILSDDRRKYNHLLKEDQDKLGSVLAAIGTIGLIIFLKSC